MKKGYDKPTLVRREKLFNVSGNGNAPALLSPAVKN